MSIKEIAVGIIVLAVVLPGFISIISLSLKAPTSTTEEIAEEGVEIIADQAIPWWIGVIQWLAGLPGIIGACFIIGFIFFLKWIGEFS